VRESSVANTIDAAFPISQTNALRIGVVAFVGTLIALVGFSGALLELINQWSRQEEYSHGFLIPFVAAYLLWTRRDALRASIGRPTWTGPLVILLAMLLHVIGQMGGIFVFSQVGFVLAVAGLILGLGGYSLFKTASIPILFLLFAIPLPGVINSMTSLQLQFISSELGTLFIRLFRIPVYLEGNIIDLGYYKLQVVEACSGLRYLYPLLSLSFLAAYLFNAPFWQRAVVFLSSVPLTIILNGIRIGLVGVTVNYWGAQAADGLLHFFEGWIIFVVCAGMIAAEIYFLARISGRSFFEVFYLPRETSETPQAQLAKSKSQAPLLSSLFLLCVTGIAAFYLASRSEVIPDRSRFISFPERIGPWQGHTSLLDPEVERLLQLDDYILSDYKGTDGKGVNLYVAYNASQRKDTQLHSPSECIPGSGWQIKKFERTSYSDYGTTFPLNRVLIEKNSIKQVVYYWFDERGKKVANEYLAKWYVHAGAIVMNRTDGALVRLITQIYSGETERDADERLGRFMHDAVPSLSEYLPSETPSPPQGKSVLIVPKITQL
jgi:exosortase D (VPLPA-CTERM-specific)